MLRTIDKNTELFCSFARTAGNIGCVIHNIAFCWQNINAIYKPFSVAYDLKPAVEAMKALNIKGAGVSMPFKREAASLCVPGNKIVQDLGIVNTLVWDDDTNVLTGYNTDYYAWKHYLEGHNNVLSLWAIMHDMPIYIMGEGAYGLTAKAAISDLGHGITGFIHRHNWKGEIKQLRSCLLLNCTPVRHTYASSFLDPTVVLISADPTSRMGAELAILQAERQNIIYTGRADFPTDIVRKVLLERLGLRP